MPVKADPILPLPPVNSKMPGVTSSLLYNGSRFVGHQKSKGNQYDVEVILQVRIIIIRSHFALSIVQLFNTLLALPQV